MLGIIVCSACLIYVIAFAGLVIWNMFQEKNHE